MPAYTICTYYELDSFITKPSLREIRVFSDGKEPPALSLPSSVSLPNEITRLFPQVQLKVSGKDCSPKLPLACNFERDIYKYHA